MKVVVTGGCGFIGSHLVRALVDVGHQVEVIDDQSTGQRLVEGASYHELDVRSESIHPVFSGANAVFHLAAEARIQVSIAEPSRTISVNVGGTANILEACRLNGVERFINSSTSAIYGMTESFPTSEDVASDCLNAYSGSKLAAEALVYCYAQSYGLRAFNLRYFNVFGEGSTVDGAYSLVVGLFQDLKRQGKPLTIVGDGEARRDFVYVRDVVDANIACMEKVCDSGECEVLNIGSGLNYSVLQIADAISANQTHIEPRLGECRETMADISKAKEYIGYQPTVDVIEWLSRA